MIDWKDTTRYSTGLFADSNEKPNTFTAISGEIKMTITCKDSQYKGWVLLLYIRSDNVCRAFPLKCKTLEEAKAKAISIAKAEVAKLVKDAEALG